ncbi:MAG: HEPN domain-containing protein [bacterium]|nr:HEPN domain-containing protein [bacterium]
MKSSADLVNGMLRKAESDLTTAKLCLDSGQSLDASCFHSQQAAERALKAFLVSRSVDAPRIHNIEKLAGLCESEDSVFGTIREDASRLTPYAVELRYDEEFWPSFESAHSAYDKAVSIVELVKSRIVIS